MQHIATLLRGANYHGRPFWAKLIFALDRCLQRRGGVFEYSDKSDCVFRLQLSRLSSDVLLSDGTFGHVGDRVIDLHFWNEQIPVPPTPGYSLAWGCAFNRSIEGSLRGLAEFLTRKPELSDIRIIRANINLEPLDRIAARHGFEAIRDPIKPSNWERMHQFGENILFSLLVLACHPRGARLKNFSRPRQLLYLSRRVCDSKQLRHSGFATAQVGSLRDECSGSKADIAAGQLNVCFTPERIGP
jgi:hypothetical protein